MPHRPILVLKTGSTIPAIRARRGDFELWFSDAMSLAADDWECLDVSKGAKLPDTGHFRGVVITGSPAMASHGEPWSGEAARWVAEAVERGLPVLGVCYGHHLLALALGGEVGPSPGGREMGTVTLALTRGKREDQLLHVLPDSFPVHMTHEESVLRLPPGIAPMGSTEQDANAVFAIPGKRVWGVQFHPEFNAAIMRSYIEARRDTLERENFKPDRMIKQVTETPEARRILHRFAAFCR